MSPARICFAILTLVSIWLVDSFWRDVRDPAKLAAKKSNTVWMLVMMASVVGNFIGFLVS